VKKGEGGADKLSLNGGGVSSCARHVGVRDLGVGSPTAQILSAKEGLGRELRVREGKVREGVASF
jgi:hypothetical protein